MRATYERPDRLTRMTRNIRGTSEELASQVRPTRARAAREEFRECVDRFYALVKLLPSDGELLTSMASVHEELTSCCRARYE